MPGLFSKTVSAICDQLAQMEDGGPRESQAPVVTAWVMEQWVRMPRFLAWPVCAGTIVFSLCGLVTRGALFHRLPAERKQSQLEAWRNSSIGACRDLVRFYRSLAVLAYYSATYTGEQRQGVAG